jgi:hypothetical protein
MGFSLSLSIHFLVLSIVMFLKLESIFLLFIVFSIPTGEAFCFGFC